MREWRDQDVEKKSNFFEGEPIALAVSGGIGAVEVIKITREFRRHGARVTLFTTPSVKRFITPLSLEWAAGEPVVSEIGREVEPLDNFRLVVVVPATFNTISKVALGISDNAVTFLIASHIAKRRPLLFVPAMNGVLEKHPLYQVQVEKLRAWGADFLEIPLEEGRFKVPDPKHVLESAMALLRRTGF